MGSRKAAIAEKVGVKIRILPSAIDDLQKGSDFYEGQGRDLGGHFLDSLFSDVESLSIYAGIHSAHCGCLRVLSRRFPYAIYYRVNEEVIEILRVLDCRQDPAGIRRLLEGL